MGDRSATAVLDLTMDLDSRLRSKEDEGLSAKADRRGRSEKREHDWVEIAAAVLLALATIASAWSAYQSSRWHGVQAREYASANATRIHSAEASDLADQEMTMDAAVFSDYCFAYAEGEMDLLAFYENRLFRPEMKTAVVAWKATGPLQNEAAPATPFDMEEYRNANREKSQALEKEAQKHTASAGEAIDHADNYILLTVLFASVLFFAGISTKFGTVRIKLTLLSLGGLVFIGSLVVLAFRPIH
jgi:hypothetical protein